MAIRLTECSGSRQNRSFAYVIIRKDDTPSIEINGEAKYLIDGYGCNGSLYVPALNHLEEHFGNPDRIVNAFLDKLSQFKPCNLFVPEIYYHFSAFLLTLVDTFQQLGFNHDIHSTTNLYQVLKKTSYTSTPGLEQVCSRNMFCQRQYLYRDPAMEDQNLLINHGFRKL